MKLLFVIVFAACGILARRVEAQIYDTNNVAVHTFAGSAFYGYLDGVGQQTMFHTPTSIVADTSSNLFVLDYSNNCIRKITMDGTVSTFVGGGQSQLPGTGTNVSLIGYVSGPMTIDHSNTLWIYSGNSNLVRISSGSYVTNIPINGIFVNAFNAGICVDSVNNVYISASYENKIYRYGTNGVLEVFVGSGNAGSIDGNGLFCSFSNPTTLAADAADNIYVWDDFNSLLRRITPSRDVTTIAGRKGVRQDFDGIGTNATFSNILAMWPSVNGDLILACGSSIRRMTATTNVTTIAGNFSQFGYTNGPGSFARFNIAYGVCVSERTIFAADSYNNRIRSIAFNPNYELPSPAELQLSPYPGLQIPGTVGRTYQIQASPDMTEWTTVATLLLTSSPYLWIDQNPVWTAA